MNFLNWFLNRRNREKDLDEEVQSHLRMAAQERIAQGESAEQARTSAVREFGNVGLVKEVTRDMWGFVWLETMMQDLRYGLRQLRRNPGFTAVAVITLALGIGANAVIFSVVNRVLIHALPYEHPERLVLVGEKTKDTPAGFWWAVAPANFVDWKRQNHVFEEIAAATYGLSVNLTGRGEPERLEAKRLTANFFPLLGVQPILGRSFAERDERVVILSHKLWARRFDSDPSVIGRALTLDDESYTVIGVMPSEFDYFPKTEIYLPNPFQGVSPTERMTKLLYVIARLKPAVTIERARAEMETITKRLVEEYPVAEKDKGWGVLVIPLYIARTRDVRRHLGVLFFAVSFVLLIACANLASLLLARGVGRHREMAVRSAVGANRARLIRQSLTESTLLGMLGGAAGLAITHWGIQLLLAGRPERFYENASTALGEIRIDWQILGYTLGLSLLAAVLFGLAPALLGSKLNVNEYLKESGISESASRWHRRALSLFVVGEIALALVLLTGAGLMIRSVARLLDEKPGYDVARVLRFDVTLPTEKYVEDAGIGPNKEKLVKITARRDLFMENLTRRLQAIPGVESAAAGSDCFDAGKVRLDGELETRSHQPDCLQWISPDYFRTLGITLVKGRDITERDTQGATGVAIVNESMARTFWPGQNLIGRYLLWQYFDYTSDKAIFVPSEIVGVVADIRASPDSPQGPGFYIPYFQDRGKMPKWAVSYRSRLTFLVRASSDPIAFATSVQKAVWDVDKLQPVSEIKTMEEDFWSSLDQRRFYMHMLIVFAFLALLLAIIGVYGVMSYSVTRRTHEIGIRMALGARSANMLRLVIGQGLKLALAGVGIGVVGALGLTRFLASLLYGVKPTDPLTFIAVSLILIVVALLASYIPARRATKVDPMVALRYE